MPEREYEVTPIGVDYTCDKCGAGVMENTGQALLSNPPKYVHRCNSCGHEDSFPVVYPAVRFQRPQGW
jgi:predicted RNA-binding Zn-ribbon protein involved in translation (DUF1610 family)